MATVYWPITGKHTNYADFHRAWACPNAVGCITHVGTLHFICNRPFKSKDIVSDLSIAWYGAVNSAEYKKNKTSV